jgi:hypothetical protein
MFGGACLFVKFDGLFYYESWLQDGGGLKCWVVGTWKSLGPLTIQTDTGGPAHFGQEIACPGLGPIETWHVGLRSWSSGNGFRLHYAGPKLECPSSNPSLQRTAALRASAAELMIR